MLPLVIAHRLSTIINAQRIIVLTADGIAEQGTHDELLARGGVYTRLYNSQLHPASAATHDPQHPTIAYTSD